MRYFVFVFIILSLFNNIGKSNNDCKLLLSDFNAS